MAAEGAHVWDESFIAGADLSAKQFYYVKLSAQDTVILTAAASDRVIGVLQNKPKSAEQATVRMIGKTKIVSDGSGTAIAAGDNIGTNNAGKAVKKTAADDFITGFSNTASAADLIVIEAFINLGLQRSA